ncbi:MAG: hypothetical protein QOK43_1846 [Acidimicrobiaceae bacterium]|nr:hypothetical protein [Acidimicrobiaceae bacterium]
MRRVRLIGTLLAGLLIVGLVVGVPVALVRFGLPVVEAGVNAEPLRRADPVGAVIDVALASVVCLCGIVWLLCAYWFASLAVAELRGSHPVLLLAGPFRPFLLKLAGSFSLLLIQQARVPLPMANAAVTVANPVGDPAIAKLPSTGARHGLLTNQDAARWVLAGARDSWADLAERHLGTWRRWEEVRDLTVAAREGAALAPTAHTRGPMAGEVVRLAADATGAHVGPPPAPDGRQSSGAVNSQALPATGREDLRQELAGATAARLAAAFGPTQPAERPVVEHSSSAPAIEPSAVGGWEAVTIKPNDRVWRLVAERWPELTNARVAEVVVAIEAENMGSPQPSYGAFEDVDETHPGWSLLFPRYVTPVVGDPIPSAVARAIPTGQHAEAETTTAPASPPAAPPHGSSSLGADAPAPGSQRKQTTTPPAGEEGGRPQGQPHHRRVTLPSGRDVGIGFALGAMSAAAMARVSHRRAYRAESPRPGTAVGDRRGPEPLRTLLAAAASIAANDEGAPTLRSAPSDDAPGFPIDPFEHDAVRLVGDTAAEAAAAIVVEQMLRDVPALPGVRVIIDRSTADAVLGAPGEIPGLCVLPTAAEVLDEAEIERARRQRVSGADADPAERGSSDRDEPLADVLVVGTATSSDVGRWAALASGGPQLGIRPVLVGGLNAGGITLDLDGACLDRDKMLPGGVDRLSRDDAAVLLAELSFALADAPAPVERPADLAFPFEDVSDSTAVDAACVATITVFGPVAVAVLGRDRAATIREAGRELIAYLVLHPGPQRRDVIIDELWPDADFDKGKYTFKNALRSVREDLWTALGRDDIAVVESTTVESKKVGGSAYQLEPGLFDADLWQFQQALRDAQQAETDSERASLLRRAVNLYGGEFVEASGALWVIAPREDLRRRALDAAVAVAALEEEAGNLEAAAATVERAIDLDAYAEDLYVRGSRVYCALGRTESARRLLARLEGALAEFGQKPMTETIGSIARAINIAERRRDLAASEVGVGPNDVPQT